MDRSSSSMAKLRREMASDRSMSSCACSLFRCPASELEFEYEFEFEAGFVEGLGGIAVEFVLVFVLGVGESKMLDFRFADGGGGG